jgi:hypothetical protein
MRIRNFQAHLFFAAILREAIFDEDRCAGIGYERADGQEIEVTGSVMCFYLFAD